MANLINGDRAIVRPSLHDQVVERLREMIVETELAPGERIDEKSLCREFAISRTPLREALKVMASEGLVDLLPNRSPRVSPVTAEIVGDLFQFISWRSREAGRPSCPGMRRARIDSSLPSRVRLMESRDQI